MVRRTVRSVEGSEQADENGQAPSSRKSGRGGAHGVPTGTYSHTANQEAKRYGEYMRNYFRTAVRMAMEARGMTQAELAYQLGMSLGSVKDRLAGRASIDIGEAAQIAGILNLKLSDLVTPNDALSGLMALTPPLEHQGCFSANTVRRIGAHTASAGFPNRVANAEG